MKYLLTRILSHVTEFINNPHFYTKGFGGFRDWYRIYFFEFLMV